MVKEFPAVLLRQAAGECTAQDDAGVPIVRCDFLFEFVDDDIGAHGFVAVPLANNSDFLASIAAGVDFLALV